MLQNTKKAAITRMRNGGKLGTIIRRAEFYSSDSGQRMDDFCEEYRISIQDTDEDDGEVGGRTRTKELSNSEETTFDLEREMEALHGPDQEVDPVKIFF